MANYRRLFVPGGTYFFTVALRDRRSDLLVREIGGLRAAVRATMDRFPFTIDAWVVLPEHMHCLWTLPPGDTNFPGRWQMIKRCFSAGVPQAAVRSASMVEKRERGIWQRRFWEHGIRDERDFAAHVDYIHFNPVKHGFVDVPGAWAFSSFRRAVARGEYPADWAGGRDEVAAAGEPGGVIG